MWHTINPHELKNLANDNRYKKIKKQVSQYLPEMNKAPMPDMEKPEGLQIKPAQ